jgi:hypothetical protein
MPNRILKDSICTSDNLDQLSPEAEVFWYRLLVQCDDYGRFDARPAILRARCFPLKLATVTDKHITTWLAELVNARLIWLYESDSKQYLQVTNWDKHQQVRAKKSKYPHPISNDNNCNQLLEHVPVIQSNPIQSESYSYSDSCAEAQKPPTDKDKIMAAFLETTRLKLPTQKKEIAYWWTSVQEILNICDKDVGRATTLVVQSFGKLTQDGLTVVAPGSLVKTIRALAAGQTLNGGNHRDRHSEAGHGLERLHRRDAEYKVADLSEFEPLPENNHSP